MKQSYNIELVGVNLNIVSADGAELVESTVAEVNAAVDNLIRVGKHFSKLDAALLSALDYCAELRKAEAKIRNLEAQIEILEAGRRIRGASEEAPEEASAPEETPDEAADATEEAKPEEDDKAEDGDKPADGADTDASRDAKFRQLEALLGSQLKFDLGND